MLEFRNISFSFPGRRGAVEVLRDVSFSCKEDEIVAVVGPSGCGKSTLLSLAIGLRKPTAGEVLVDGRPVQGTDGRLGMLFQQTTLLPWRSVLENVELGLEIRGEPKDRRRARALSLMKQYGLGGFERKYPHALSGGMQKRAALAQTLAVEPTVLLLDEPFAALDAQTRVVIQNDVVKICRAGKRSMIIVTHDIAEAISMADRVVVLTQRPATVKKIYENSVEPTGGERRRTCKARRSLRKFFRIWTRSIRRHRHRSQRECRGMTLAHRLPVILGRLAVLAVILAGAEVGVRSASSVSCSSSARARSSSSARHRDGRTAFFLPNVGVTVLETLLGLVPGSLLGMAIGLLLPQLRLLSHVFNRC